MGSAPLLFVFNTVANVRNTVLLDMRLTAGVADVTGAGAVRFENVSLTDVTLVQGDVISTGLHRYDAVYDEDAAEDDAGMDAGTEVSLEWVPPEHRSVFGEHYIISEAMVSYCPDGTAHAIPPWCLEVSPRVNWTHAHETSRGGHPVRDKVCSRKWGR